MTDPLAQLHKAHPERAITSRRHPLAFAAYGMVLAIGLIFVTHWLSHGAVPIQHRLGEVWVWAWEFQLVSGGSMSLLSIVVKPRVSPKWPDLADLLHIEAIGAFVGALGVLTYLTAAVIEVGPARVGPAGTILGVLITGLIYRAFTAPSEARQVTRLGQLVDAVQALNDEAAKGG